MGTDTLKVQVGPDGVRAGASIDELVDIARYAASQNSAWNDTNCTGLVYAISNVAGAPLNPASNQINIVNNNPLTVKNLVGYAVSADQSDAWLKSSAITGSSISYSKLQAGDILRIQTANHTTTAGVHSMIVTQVLGTSPSQIYVVDNWGGKVTEHRLSEVINFLNASGTGSINVFSIHRLDASYVSQNVSNSTLAGLGDGNFGLLPAPADLPSSISTTATLAVGSSMTSSVGFASDSDWFKVYLTAGQTYSFAVRGQGTGSNTLVDPMIRLRSPSQAILATDDNSGGNLDARISGFTATQSGYHYIAAYANGSGTGTYTVSATRSVTSSDIAGSTSTASTLSPGTSSSSTVGSSGDQDWFRINLVAGNTYTFTLNAGTGSSLDAYLRLLNSSGTQLAYNDDASGSNSAITFKATTSGTYYLSAQGYSTTTGSYTIAASAGTTSSSGGATEGPDSLFGTSAGNSMSGLGGNDTIYGLAGNDSILGGSGNDNIFGGSGNDALKGDAGNDVINSGTGNDTLYGGTGADSFVFDTTAGSTNVDVIIGYVVADDTIRLENSIFTRLSVGTLSASAFASNTTGYATDSLDRIIYESDSGKIFYDADGSGAGARVHFATITAGLSLSQSDFLVI